MYPAWNKIADSIAMPVKIIPLLRIMLPEKKKNVWKGYYNKQADRTHDRAFPVRVSSRFSVMPDSNQSVDQYRAHREKI